MSAIDHDKRLIEEQRALIDRLRSQVERLERDAHRRSIDDLERALDSAPLDGYDLVGFLGSGESETRRAMRESEAEWKRIVSMLDGVPPIRGAGGSSNDALREHFGIRLSITDPELREKARASLGIGHDGYDEGKLLRLDMGFPDVITPQLKPGEVKMSNEQKAQAGDECDPETFDANDPKYSELVNPRCEQQGDGETSKWVIVCD